MGREEKVSIPDGRPLPFRRNDMAEKLSREAEFPSLTGVLYHLDGYPRSIASGASLDKCLRGTTFLGIL